MRRRVYARQLLVSYLVIESTLSLIDSTILIVVFTRNKNEKSIDSLTRNVDYRVSYNLASEPLDQPDRGAGFVSANRRQHCRRHIVATSATLAARKCSLQPTRPSTGELARCRVSSACHGIAWHGMAWRGAAPTVRSCSKQKRSAPCFFLTSLWSQQSSVLLHEYEYVARELEFRRLLQPAANLIRVNSSPPPAIFKVCRRLKTRSHFTSIPFKMRTFSSLEPIKIERDGAAPPNRAE